MNKIIIATILCSLSTACASTSAPSLSPIDKKAEVWVNSHSPLWERTLTTEAASACESSSYTLDTTAIRKGGFLKVNIDCSYASK